MKKIALFGFTAALMLGLSPVLADETYKIDPMHTTLGDQQREGTF
jgi:hypothetical protein